MSHQTESGPYQLFMLALCVLALGMLAAETFFPLDPATRQLMIWADLVVCIFFLADFAVSLARAPRKLRYLATWGWIDLVSSIPAYAPLRWGRLARVARILRVLRGARAARHLAAFLLERRASGALAAVLLLTLLVVLFASVAILHLETAPDRTIRGPGDALWWAAATITTVGYGDVYPKSPEGRVLAVLIMAAGIALYGTLCGLVASWILRPQAVETESDLVALRKEIAALRHAIESRGA